MKLSVSSSMSWSRFSEWEYASDHQVFVCPARVRELGGVQGSNSGSMTAGAKSESLASVSFQVCARQCQFP